MQTVREPSPPPTPSRLVEDSPTSRNTQFEDAHWENKRRRIDTATDIYFRSSNASEYSAEVHHAGAIDPSLSSTYTSPGDPFQQNIPSSQCHQHRPSLHYTLERPLAYAAPNHQQRTPAPIQRHGSVLSSFSAPPPYSAGQQSSSYGPPIGYYPEPHPGVHGPSHHGSYYNPPGYVHTTPSGLEGPYNHQPYNNYTFTNLGMDQNSFNRKRRGNLPKEATAILKDWFAKHRESPYPSEDEKMELCGRTQLTLSQVRHSHFPAVFQVSPLALPLYQSLALGYPGISGSILAHGNHADNEQVSNWFINARRRAPQKEQRDARDSIAEPERNT